MKNGALKNRKRLDGKWDVVSNSSISPQTYMQDVMFSALVWKLK